MIENCESCVFGVRDSIRLKKLHCHRHAPIAYIRELVTTRAAGNSNSVTVVEAVWPSVFMDYFCGDWELKDAS